MWNKRQAGVTLVELIVAMVIITVGIAGMTVAFTRTANNSADPLVQKQMAVIAEGIMEEILLKPFDSTNPGLPLLRSQFNDVQDFQGYGLNAAGTAPVLGITDVNGTAIPGLETYAVEVRIVQPATLLSDGVVALQIRVTVTRGAFSYELTGWRTDYS